MVTSYSVGLQRPGAALGDYPEREPTQPGALERLIGRLAGLLGPAPADLRAGALQRFVAAVNDAERTLEPMSRIDALAAELRRDLRREGMTDALLARAFALVRLASARHLGMRHYDCQVLAGRALLTGALAEMQTGEGKTLAATLPACAAALAGVPVHVVTANDYLVTRDAADMAPLYRALGLSVGAITESSTRDMRRTAYARDVTYVTSKQLAFDYLRDRLTRGRRKGQIQLRLRKLVGDVGAGTDGLLMRGLCFAIVDEVDSVLVDEARTPFVIARESATGPIVKQCRAALAVAATLGRGDYDVDQRRRRVRLSAAGTARVSGDTRIEGSARLREALVNQALAALHVYARDRDYLVRDGAVRIIDPHTGRVMDDRSWERGLHQMIECKESCAVTAPRETLARLTYQRLFRRYLRLSGMTGTAREVRHELASTYGLPFVRVPTHNPDRRHAQPHRVSIDRESRWLAIAAATRAEHERGRPVLIGTRSVADSEQLSALLEQHGIRHTLLNARQDADEARIVARAGQRGAVTVATNMAGRGTDIELGPGVAALGGLHVIVAEHNDAARLDRQLIGRCARQGDPGSHVIFMSPDDTLLDQYGSRLLLAALRRCRAGSPVFRLMLTLSLSIAQRRCERDHRNARRDLSIMQDQMNRLLALAGPQE